MNKQEIEKAIDSIQHNRYFDDGVMTTVIEALCQQLTNGWIPVDNPPAEYGTYIVAWMPAGYTADNIKKATKSEATHFYEMLEFDPDNDEAWETVTQYDSYKIIAWQPLPEPYKEVPNDRSN